MVVNRRFAIRQILCISAGVVLIPSCMQDKSKSAILLKNISIDPGQEKLLEELAETIIPAGSTPGAKDVYAHLFALKMLDDCYNKENQQKFINGMKQFESMVQKRFSKSFVQCSVQEREAMLHDMEMKKESNEDPVFFYSTIKKLTIQGYSTSQYYLTKVQVYALIPGRFHGCVAVKNTDKKPS